MDPLTLIASLASIASFLGAAIEALRERTDRRTRPKQAREQHQGALGRLEEWGRNNPVKLGLGLGVVFLVAALLLARITDPSSSPNIEVNTGGSSRIVQSSRHRPETPITETTTTSTTVPCLPSNTSPTNNSMGTADGPLKSGEQYEGTIIADDEDWLGYCVKKDGPVTITFGNACPSSEGPNDLYAYFLDPGEEEYEYINPKPGQFEPETMEVSSDTPHFIHILDLEESDIGNDVCGNPPWTLTVVGDLSPVLKTDVK